MTKKYNKYNDYFEWPRMPDQHDVLAHDMYLQLLDTEWLSLDKIRTGQISQLDILLGRAKENAPYYAKIFAGINMQNARTFFDIWKQIPVTTLDTIAKVGNSMKIEKSPKEHGQKKRIELTTAIHPPVPILITEYWRTLRQAWFARLFHNFKWNQQNTFVELRPGNNDQHAVIENGWKLATSSGNAIVGNMTLDADQLPNWINEIEGDFYIRTNARLMQKVLAQYEKGELKNFKGAIVFIQNKTQLEMCNNAKSNGLSMIPVMIQQGLGMIAAPCPEMGNLHVQSESVLIEDLNGTIVATSLHNFAMPMVRVATGLPIKFDKPCKCGRGLETITLLQ